MSHRHLLVGAAALAIPILFLALWTSAPAGAATPAPVQVEVDTPIDSNEAAYQVCSPADDDCSLRGAISKANADAGNAYIISLPPNTYTLTIAGPGEPFNAAGNLDMFTNLAIRFSIEGQKAVIDGNGLDRVLHIVDGQVTL